MTIPLIHYTYTTYNFQEITTQSVCYTYATYLQALKLQLLRYTYTTYHLQAITIPLIRYTFTTYNLQALKLQSVRYTYTTYLQALKLQLGTTLHLHNLSFANNNFNHYPTPAHAINLQ